MAILPFEMTKLDSQVWHPDRTIQKRLIPKVPLQLQWGRSSCCLAMSHSQTSQENWTTPPAGHCLKILSLLVATAQTKVCHKSLAIKMEWKTLKKNKKSGPLSLLLLMCFQTHVNLTKFPCWGSEEPQGWTSQPPGQARHRLASWWLLVTKMFCQVLHFWKLGIKPQTHGMYHSYATCLTLFDLMILPTFWHHPNMARTSQLGRCVFQHEAIGPQGSKNHLTIAAHLLKSKALFKAEKQVSVRGGWSVIRIAEGRNSHMIHAKFALLDEPCGSMKPTSLPC